MDSEEINQQSEPAGEDESPFDVAAARLASHFGITVEEYLAAQLEQLRRPDFPKPECITPDEVADYLVGQLPKHRNQHVGNCSFAAMLRSLQPDPSRLAEFRRQVEAHAAFVPAVSSSRPAIFGWLRPSVITVALAVCAPVLLLVFSLNRVSKPTNVAQNQKSVHQQQSEPADSGANPATDRKAQEQASTAMAQAERQEAARTAKRRPPQTHRPFIAPPAKVPAASSPLPTPPDLEEFAKTPAPSTYQALLNLPSPPVPRPDSNPAQQSTRPPEVLASQTVAGLRSVVANLDDYTLQTSATVPFRFNQYKLSDAAMHDLDQLASQVQADKRFFIVVEGYTDRTGAKDYNDALSRRRADEVVLYLVKKHDIPIYRIHMIGSGEAKPVDEGHGQFALAKNRRVEVKVFEAADSGSDAAPANADRRQR